jgi:outer membrane protein OmpA-like peptidoglycan-associated protein
MPSVRQLAQQIKNSDEAKVVISAYADAAVQAGSGARRLSLQRAVLVRDALARQGVEISRMSVKAQTAEPGTINPDRVEVSVE